MHYFEHEDRERELEEFGEILYDSDFCIAGYGEGCVNALMFLKAYDKRIDNLILIRPLIDEWLSDALKDIARKGVRVEIFTAEEEVAPKLKESLTKVSTLYIFKNFKNIR